MFPHLDLEKVTHAHIVFRPVYCINQKSHKPLAPCVFYEQISRFSLNTGSGLKLWHRYVNTPPQPSSLTCWVTAVSRKELWPQTSVMTDGSYSVSALHPTTKEVKRETESLQTADSTGCYMMSPHTAPLFTPQFVCVSFRSFTPDFTKAFTCMSPLLVPMQRALPSLLQHRQEMDWPWWPDARPGPGSKHPTSARVSESQMKTEEPSANAIRP